MKENFSEEYNLVLQLNQRKKLICIELFDNFKKVYQNPPIYTLKDSFKPDFHDLAEPSTFRKIIDDYYEEQKAIADTVRSLTEPSTFTELIEEYYEIQKHIIDSDSILCSSSESEFNEKDIERNIQELIEPLSFQEESYEKLLEEEQIMKVTESFFSNQFIDDIKNFFNNISLSKDGIKITINSNISYNISRREFYMIYKRISNQIEYKKIEKFEIICLFCISQGLSSIYYVLDNEALADLQNLIIKFQISAHFYVKNLGKSAFSFLDDPKKAGLLMSRTSAPHLFWYLLKFIIRNFPKWG
jgi:hypothetical protein